MRAAITAVADGYTALLGYVKMVHIKSLESEQQIQVLEKRLNQLESNTATNTDTNTTRNVH